MTFRNIEEALSAINDDAAKKAWAYIERDAPPTAEAIQYLVDNKWSKKKIMDRFRKTYGPTEEKTMHKVGLVVAALVAGRVLE